MPVIHGLGGRKTLLSLQGSKTCSKPYHLAPPLRQISHWVLYRLMLFAARQVEANAVQLLALRSLGATALKHAVHAESWEDVPELGS